MSTNRETIGKMDELNAIIERLHHNTTSFYLKEGPLKRELVDQLLEDLSISLEELGVANEELLQQNEELITTRDFAERAYQRFENLFNFASDGFLITDQNGKILGANLAAAELFRASPPSLGGRLLIQFVPLAQRKSFRSQQNLINNHYQEHSRNNFPPEMHLRRLTWGFL